MSEGGNDRSRRGLNPNAQAFVPNPGARPFVPGQPYLFSNPPPIYAQHPPPPPPGAFPLYQQTTPTPHLLPSANTPYGIAAAAAATAASVPSPPPPVQNFQYQQQQPSATAAAGIRMPQPSVFQQQQQQPPQLLQQQPPLDAWDADETEPELEQIEETLNRITNDTDTPSLAPEEAPQQQPTEQEESEESDEEEEERASEGDKLSSEEEIVAAVTVEDNKKVSAAAAAVPAELNVEEAKDEISDEVAQITSKMKRNVYVDDGTRKVHVNIVFIGHVDAGKSTIGGQLMYLTGMVDKRTLEKYEKEAKDKGRESWYLSWALDINDEEREKGKTVECGRAYFETEKKHFTILDAPGHKSFVPNMISGATQADLAVLVISARKGEFETGFDRGGQTREHAMLVKTAGVKHMIVLVNKMDDPTVNWDEERYKEIQNKLTPYLRKCGYNPKSDIVYIPVSGLTGAFLKNRPSAQFGSWYTGPCFIDYIDNMLPAMSRDFEGAVRVIIADKYSDMGTIVTGKIESGIIAKGDTLVVMPNRTNVQVIQLWSDDAETDRVMSGDNIKLKLKGVEDADILSGFIICSPDSLCHVGRVFDAEVVILDHRSIIASGYSCVLHIQSAVEEVTVKTVICKIDKKSGEKVRARFVKQDEKCIMRLESAEPFCLEAFKDFPQMGRFTLRDEGRTIAIGKVLKVIE